MAAEKYYVTFSEEIDDLIEGQADISDELTEPEAKAAAEEYLAQPWAEELTGVVATFHNLKAYQAAEETGDYGPTEVGSILYKRKGEK